MNFMQDSEREKYKYESFPHEFMWEFGDSMIEGLGPK
jgi:hypothetical protein